MRGVCVAPHDYTWAGVFSRGLSRESAIATQLTFVSLRYESAAHVVIARRRAPATATYGARATIPHLSVMTSCLGGCIAVVHDHPAALRPPPPQRPDPFMEQLHVAMSVVGRQAGLAGATPALPQGVFRRCPGSGQGAVGAPRGGDAPNRHRRGRGVTGPVRAGVSPGAALPPFAPVAHPGIAPRAERDMEHVWRGWTGTIRPVVR